MVMHLETQHLNNIEGNRWLPFRLAFSNPSLELQDFGGIGTAGVFRFAKGDVSDFHYMNLSGGEKAAFDLLLDAFVKANPIYALTNQTTLRPRCMDGCLKRSSIWCHRNPSFGATHSVGFDGKLMS